MRKDCRFCHKRKFKLILDLGQQPLAGEFLFKSQLGQETFYPLRLFQCLNCQLVQLLDVVPKEELFQSYLSSVTLADHFLAYAEELCKRFLKFGDFVVEIGSNDGVLLKPLQDMGMEVLGIEPVKKIAKLALAEGVPTKIAYFNETVARKIPAKAKAILANNVFAHIDDMDSVMKGIDYLLADDGVFIFENHYLLDLLATGQFDGIYHERLNYYSISALAPFLQKYGLEIFEVRPIATHGGSIRVYTKRLQPKVFQKFKTGIELNKQVLVGFLQELKQGGTRVVGFGAAGRANTLLNYYGIDHTLVEYIIDESPARYGKYTPGTHIPVIPLNGTKLDQVDVVLILAWNYQKQIMKKCQEQGFRGRYLIPLPVVEFI